MTAAQLIAVNEAADVKNNNSTHSTRETVVSTSEWGTI